MKICGVRAWERFIVGTYNHRMKEADINNSSGI